MRYDADTIATGILRQFLIDQSANDLLHNCPEILPALQTHYAGVIDEADTYKVWIEARHVNNPTIPDDDKKLDIDLPSSGIFLHEDEALAHTEAICQAAVQLPGSRFSLAYDSKPHVLVSVAVEWKTYHEGKDEHATILSRDLADFQSAHTAIAFVEALHHLSLTL